MDQGSIEVQVIGGSTLFEPRNIETRESGATTMTPVSREVRAPEKKLTLFALRLAILEKTATGLGTLGFIWATVVLLGGFAISLDDTDFWFITTILLIEGTRIFSRSHELEWQHQSTWSITDTGINSFKRLRSSSHSFIAALKSVLRSISAYQKGRKGREISNEAPNMDRVGNWSTKKLPSRQWVSSDVPFLPYVQWVFVSKNISKILHWLQIVAAIACVALSSMKLIKHNYGEAFEGDKKNLKAALIIFYSLALSEAILFLLEKAYWEAKVIYSKVLEDVSKECELGPEGVISVNRFFYDAYSKCLSGSIFDGLNMDMVSFGMELLASDSSEEQLIGAKILRKFSTSARFCEDTLQKIGVTLSTVERLVEMLNWKDLQEEEIRQSAAIIVSKLAGKKQNSLRVAGIAGAMESISSLLYANRNPSHTADAIGEKRLNLDATGEKRLNLDHEHYGFYTFNHLGLVILKKLARNHDNCGKIGSTRGLLPKIIDFTHAEERVLRDEGVTSQILTVKRSLQVLRMLASTTGATGKRLREEIAECVFTISNIRSLLRYGGKHPSLQCLGVEILTSLALEDEATERIGGTGGIINQLLTIFLREGLSQSDRDRVRIASGEALAMLVLGSESNCLRVLKTGALDELVGSLGVPLLRENAARILRNLCAYSSDDCFSMLRGVIEAVPMVLKGIVSDEESKLQEVMLGLGARAFRFMSPEESRIMFGRAGETEARLCDTLVRILRKHSNPPTKIPRVRRFTIELAIWMMMNTEESTRIFKDYKLERELENVLDTTSEIESFHIFSGTVGLNRFRAPMHSLVHRALELLAD